MQADPKPQVTYLILSNGLISTTKGKKNIAERQEIAQERVELNHNNCESILKDIEHINFKGTLFLQLSYNNISSLQAIRNLQAPNLTDLHLSFNHITRIFSLTKAYFPKLKTLSLMKNPIADEERLQLTSFPLLNKLLLDDPREKNSKFTFQNSAFLVKSFPAFIETVRWSVNKIKQDQFDAMRAKKKPTNVKS